MYKDFFHLNELPFSIAPDPRFLFMSDRHREAMAHLLYGLQGEGGIVLLTGEVGTGKTTICRSLLDQLPENIDVAFILNPRMSVEELLQTICEEFHIEVAQERRGIKSYVDALNARLLTSHAQGRRAILIVDEAQNLDPAVLEQLRLLTNLETSSRKLLQIFLIGQPELKSMLARPEMRQVSQRVIARYHLIHLNLPEVSTYIAHRLRVSGASPLIFPDALIKHVYRASGGVPRLINLVCDRALLGAYAQGQQQVTLPIIRQAANEVLTENPRHQRNRIIAAVFLFLVAGSAILLATQFSESGFGRSQSRGNLTLHPLPMDEPTQAVAASATATPASDSSAVISTSGIESVVTSLPSSTLKLPGNITPKESEAIAYQALFKLYGISFDKRSVESPCQQAEAQGMRCYAGHGGLSDLLLLDRPVVLRLSPTDGKEYTATLTALDHQQAILMLEGGEQRISLSSLANSWQGQFDAIWKAPPDFNGQIALNQKGPSVTWLRHVMESADGIHDNGSDLFDAALIRRIRTFQLTEGIKPDGLVGPLTVIRLEMRSGNGGPRLATPRKG